MDMLTSIALVLIGLTGLFFGGNWLVDGASRIASALGVPPLIIGLTVVAFGTSAPELMVSVRAALSGSSGIALGNVVGSNIANVGLILGLTGLIAPIGVRASLVRREIPIMIGVSALAYVFLFDHEISRLDGGLLFAGFIAFNVAMVLITLRRSDEQRASDAATVHAEEAPSGKRGGLLLEWLRLLGGIVILLIGAEATVNGATTIAETLGVPEVVIGLTLVAFGTSLPELAASVIAALRGEADIAVGNVIGSNIANLLLILGITALVQPIPISEPAGTFLPFEAGMISFDYPLMLLFALLMLPFALDRVLNRVESVLFLATYVSYIALSFIIK